jgi:hypothetical protein
MTKPVELPQGTLEMLILKAVSLGPLHGYGILLRIQQISGERLEILQGSFYTAIYPLTAAGTRQLKAETAKWTDMAAVVAGILDKKAGEI